MATESSAIFNFFSQLSKDVAINGDVTKLATDYGQIGVPKNLPAGTDANTLINPGCYQINTGGINLPSNGAYFVDVYVREASSTDRFYVQVARRIASKSDQFSRYFIKSTDTWSDWVEFITKENLATSSTLGIMQPGDGLKSEDNGIVSVDETVVRTSGDQTIGGDKIFSSSILMSTDNGQCRYAIQNKSLPAKRTDPISQNMFIRFDFFNGGGLSNNTNRMALLQFTKNTNGSCTMFMGVNNPYKDDAGQATTLGCGWGKGSNDVPFAYAYCPTPAADSNNNYIATTEWVRNYTPPSSNKLTTARSIDGINFNGEENVVHYTTCSTAAETVDKVVTLDNFVLTTGSKVYVKFTVANTASNPTLNVSGTGAKAIIFNNANIPASYLKIGLYEFIYDGTYWNFIGGGGGSDTENGNTTLNNNFNNLINPGRFFVTSTKGTTTNAPMDVTAEWWVDVSVYGSGTGRRILQEARMHTTTTSDATSGPSHILIRCCSNTTWGPWQYSYSQFAG